MGPELALAIEACVIETSSLIVSLVKKINEVRLFKKKCSRLGREAVLLHQLLDSKRSAVRGLQTIHNFKFCIRKVEDFVDSCRTWSISTVGLEVFVRHEYSSLVTELNALRDVFIFDSVVGSQISCNPRGSILIALARLIFWSARVSRSRSY
jgi:hypothetical protein